MSGDHETVDRPLKNHAISWSDFRLFTNNDIYIDVKSSCP